MGTARGELVGLALLIAATGCGDNAKKLAALNADLDRKIQEAQPDPKAAAELVKTLEEKREKIVELRQHWEPPEDALIPALKNAGARAFSDAGGLTVETPNLGEALAVLRQGAPLTRPRSLVAAEGRAQLKLHAAPELERPPQKLQEPDTPGVPPDLSLSIKELQDLEAKLAKLRAAKRDAAKLAAMKRAEQAHDALVQKLKEGATLAALLPLLAGVATAPSVQLEIGLDRKVTGEVTFAEDAEEDGRDLFKRYGLTLAGEGAAGLKVSGTLKDKPDPPSSSKKRKRKRGRRRR